MDILISMDYLEFYFLIKDVKVDSGEPIGRPTPPGWKCIGNNNSSYECTQYSTFQIKQKSSIKKQTNY